MRYRQYVSPKEFAADVMAGLEQFYIQNNLFFSNIRTGLANEESGESLEGLLMATVTDDNGKVLLTAAQMHPHPLLLFETGNVRNNATVQLLARQLSLTKPDLGIVMSEGELSAEFARAYAAAANRSFKPAVNMILYVAEQVAARVPTPSVGGALRLATQADMHFLPYWLADFVPACGLGAFDLAFGLERAQKWTANQKGFIWDDGGPKAYAATTRQVNDSIFLGDVYTPPHLRGNGYSYACVYALTQKLLEGGNKYCALYADSANPYSNKVYQKIGYTKIFRYDQYAFFPIEA